MIEDLDAIETGAAADCEICIIGSGPVGLSMALEFVGRRERVIVLESGGDSHEPEAEALSAFENVGQRRAHPSAVRRRIFGGTSSVWSGRCVPFSPIDFQQRAWISNSGWPIAAEDIAPYLDRAGRVLQMGPAVFDDRIWSLLGSSPPDRPWDPSTFETQVFQASVVRSPRTRVIPAPADPDSEGLGALQHSSAPQAEDVAEYSRKALQDSPNIRVLLHAQATQVLTDDSGSSVTGVRVQSLQGKTLTINARRVVLACGAIDNARQLLLSRARNGAGLGNDHDQVGRYLLDHHYAPIATIAGSQAQRLRRRLGYRWLDIGGSRHVYLTGVSLAAQRQREDGLSRATLYPFEHVARKSALQSVGQILSGLRNKGESASSDDWRNALRHPLEVAQGALDRYGRRLPTLNPVSQLDIGCNVEQWPNPQSRVTLGTQVDALGQPMARLDWRLDPREYRTYCATAKLFVSECSRLGLEVPQITPWAQGQDTEWAASLHDMAHPMCTTRMSADPRHGVVDANCAVHGVRGLYVAGSSVFSTGGTSNPTLTAVSLAIRLADHLRAASDSVAPGVAGTRVESLESPRVRVGVIGTGNRVRSMYGPVLAACSKSIEVVGFVGRGAEGIARVTGELGWSPFESIGSLVFTGKPDFLIVAVSDSANANVMRTGLAMGLPVLGETPLAWSEKEGRALVGLARSRGLALGIAEQFPFLPAERLKAKLIELGAIGAVISCHNDFATYSYHGIAQLRAYMGYGRPAIAVRARNYKFGHAGAPDGRVPASDSLAADATWQQATIDVAGGGLMEYRYSDAYAALPTRAAGTLRVVGNSGHIEDERLLSVDRMTGSKFEAAVSREMGAEGQVQAVRVVHPTLGEISWRWPAGTHHLSDEQVAVWSHVDAFQRAVRYGGAPLYAGRQAQEDIEIVRAIRYSAAREGARVRLPLRTELEKALTLAHKVRRRT